MKIKEYFEWKKRLENENKEMDGGGMINDVAVLVVGWSGVMKIEGKCQKFLQ